METYMRTCNVCGETKPLEDFPIHHGDSRLRVCKPCFAQQVNASKRSHRAAKKAKPEPVVEPEQVKLVLIDRGQQRVVLCVVENTQPLPEGIHTGRLAREFILKGYHIMVAGQLEPVNE